MLHLFALSSLPQECLDRVGSGDDVLLQHGAFWAAFSGHRDNPKLHRLMARDIRVYVLQEWLTVNGLTDGQILAGVEIIDYSGLVGLTVKNSVIHTWR
ncbi:MAG: DsrH/TusB family sulfur metabolism protein [Methylomonas sp.]|jgi:tRNA 2-thiouridine synthesizing protein B